MHRWHYLLPPVCCSVPTSPTSQSTNQERKRIKKNTRFLVNYRIYPCLLMLVLEIPPTYLPYLSSHRAEARPTWWSMRKHRRRLQYLIFLTCISPRNEVKKRKRTYSEKVCACSLQTQREEARDVIAATHRNGKKTKCTT